MVWNNNRWFSLNVLNFQYARACLRNGSYAIVYFTEKTHRQDGLCVKFTEFVVCWRRDRRLNG